MCLLSLAFLAFGISLSLDRRLLLLPAHLLHGLSALSDFFTLLLAFPLSLFAAGVRLHLG